MASIKNIVKVMNFHSLIRVDKAKKTANKYFEFEKEIKKLLYSIVNNRNLKLDKKIMQSNPNGITLNIYIGNDLGFCGAFNHQIYSALKKDTDSYKIIIGKKIFNIQDDKILLKVEKSEFLNRVNDIEKIINDYIYKNQIKELNIIYNHYYSVSNIVYDQVKVFPISEHDDDLDENVLKNDFIIETDVDELLTGLIVMYISYNLRIFESNSFASENVMRERITRESIKKIDEIETEKFNTKRREEKDKNFKRQIGNQQKIIKE